VILKKHLLGGPPLIHSNPVNSESNIDFLTYTGLIKKIEYFAEFHNTWEKINGRRLSREIGDVWNCRGARNRIVLRPIYRNMALMLPQVCRIPEKPDAD
jgi:hypothetical protein